jgi:hypothetical protein
LKTPSPTIVVGLVGRLVVLAGLLSTTVHVFVSESRMT